MEQNKLHKGECPQCGEYKMHTPAYYLFIGGMLVVFIAPLFALGGWIMGASAQFISFFTTLIPAGGWLGVIIMIISPFTAVSKFRICENCTWSGIPLQAQPKVIKESAQPKRDTLIK